MASPMRAASAAIVAHAGASTGEWKGAVTRKNEVETTGLRSEKGVRACDSSGDALAASMAFTSAASTGGGPETTAAE